MRRFLSYVVFLLGVNVNVFAKSGCEFAFDSGGKNVFVLESEIIGGLESIVLNKRRLPTQDELKELDPNVHSLLKEKFAGQIWNKRIKIFLDSAIENNASKKLSTLRKDLLKSLFTLVVEDYRWPDLAEFAALHNLSEEITGALTGLPDSSKAWKLISKYHPVAPVKFRKDLANVYAQFCREYTRTIDESDFAREVGVNEATMAWMFNGINAPFKDFADLKATSQRLFPKAFREVLDTDIFDEAKSKKLLDAIETKKRLVVTTAIAGALVDEEFLGALETYCEANDAALIVIPADMTTNDLDPALLDKDWVHVITHETEVSRYFRISNIKISPKQLNPLASLESIGPRSQSVVVGSPKMFTKVVPTVDNAVTPHLLFSTGAVTTPNYSGRRFIQKRTDYIASEQHRMGAVVLERVSGKSVETNGAAGQFHARHIEYFERLKGFHDLGHTYTASSVDADGTLAMVLGDLHVASLDRELFERVKAQIKKLKPKYLVLHDILDGQTVNHHQAHQLLSRANLANGGGARLSDELSEVIKVLNELTDIDSDLEIVVVRSNHDMWLDRWLEEGKFMADPFNMVLGLELASAMAKGLTTNPLEFAMKSLGETKEGKALIQAELVDPERVTFLQTGEKRLVGPKHQPVQVGLHGHAGINGSKGITLRSVNIAADRSIIAHTHTVGRENDAVNVGTLTHLELPYNRDGVSNWVQSIATIGPNGEVQVLMNHFGEFYASDKNRKTKDFHGKNYPSFKTE